VERVNPYPKERVLFPLVEIRNQWDLRVWVLEEGVEKNYPISLSMRGDANLVLPPRKEDHQLTLVVESKTGRRCTRVLQYTEGEERSEEQKIDVGDYSAPDMLVTSGFGLSHHSGWGGESMFSPSFDLVFAGRVSDAGYMLGGDLNIDFRERYRKYLLKARMGFLNGFTLGPVVLLTGGGLGYDEISQIDVDFSEQRLYENNHLYGYWRSEIFLWFGQSTSISAGYIPRWHWDDSVSSAQPWDSYSWHTSIRFLGLMCSYQNHSVKDQSIHTVMVGLGGNLFE
jgi:hypothetical protein